MHEQATEGPCPECAGDLARVEVAKADGELAYWQLSGAGWDAFRAVGALLHREGAALVSIQAAQDPGGPVRLLLVTRKPPADAAGA